VQIPLEPGPKVVPGYPLCVDGYTMLADRLEILAPAVPYTLIADAYDPDVAGEDPPRGPQRLDRWLRAWCDGPGEAVRREGKILHFRRRRWFVLRPRQVPDRVSRPWETLLRKDRVLSLDTLFEMASRLPDEQASLVVGHWAHRPALPNGYYLHVFQSIRGYQLNALRLLATLAPRERAQLLRGETCPIAARAEQPALLEHQAAPFSNGGQTRIEREGHAPFRRPLEAELEADEHPPEPPVPRWLRLERKPAHAWIGSDIWEDDDLDRALARERELDPGATRETLSLLEGTRWTLFFLADPSDPQPNWGASWLTRESARRRR
jgi:hypothetical protein